MSLLVDRFQPLYASEQDLPEPRPETGQHGGHCYVENTLVCGWPGKHSIATIIRKLATDKGVSVEAVLSLIIEC